MKKQNIIGITALFLIICLSIFVVFSENSAAKNIKGAINMSLEEDFKIKESLGQIFFVENEDDSVSASTSVTVSDLISPSATGKITQKLVLGQPQIIIECEKYSSILATGDGIIESVSSDRITLRHYDGKLSEYKNVGSVVKKGDKVKMGESIGYAKDAVEYKLYENLIAIDPLEYIS
ncbi:MAG: M23 family metallopeptidase [Clostridiales bacterium]|nr:M23 family metallopeptidase [Clostridiales bacterium]